MLHTMYNEHQFLLQNIIPCFVMAVRIAHQNKCAGGIVLVRQQASHQNRQASSPCSQFLFYEC